MRPWIGWPISLLHSQPRCGEMQEAAAMLRMPAFKEAAAPTGVTALSERLIYTHREPAW